MSHRHPLHNCHREDVARAIGLLQQAGQLAHVELFRGVMQGAIGLGVIGSRETPWTAGDMPAGSLPTVLLIGDDDYASIGPAGWRGAITWARAALVHGAGAAPEYYRRAVAMAILPDRLLLVETDSKHVEEWTTALAGKPALIVVPADGLHLVAPAQETMQ